MAAVCSSVFLKTGSASVLLHVISIISPPGMASHAERLALCRRIATCTHACVNTADDPSTSDKNLANLGPVTRVLQTRLRLAGYTLGFAMNLVISSIKVVRVVRWVRCVCVCVCDDNFQMK